MKYILTISIAFISFSLFSQDLSQTIRGRIYDQISHTSLPGVNIILLNTDPVIGTVSDMDGYFKIENVVVGRVSIQFSFLGYKTITMNNVSLTTGKELVLNIEMEESIASLNAVTIEAKSKAKVNNEMTTISARTFSIEESQRYAGSFNDVSRMASNFAGVQGTDDSRNDIVIRGNSPTGVLFRFEGTDIPNPNHFAAFGTSGGPISILNNNVLANSDFMTGAFPAEYGNANAGVFDLKMRSGNNEKTEFLGQIGFNGLEFMAEGPFSKKSKASYLINYRYSTLSLFALMGINFGTGTAIPEYQDLSFKLNFPRKNGNTSFFGIGGISYIEFLDSERDTSETDFFTQAGEDTRFRSNIGVAGLTHSIIINDNSYIKFVASVTAHSNRIQVDSVDKTTLLTSLIYSNTSSRKRQNLSIYYNKRFNIKNNIRGGIHLSRLDFNLLDSTYSNIFNRYITLSDFKGATYLIRPFIQWQYKFSDRTKLNSGVYTQYLLLNNSKSIEPRLGFSWDTKPNQTFSFATGLHSQMMTTETYFAQNEISTGVYATPNKNLDFTRSAHFIIGYDLNFKRNIRLKFESYLQYLYQVPIEINSSSYSTLNQGANFIFEAPDSLANNGTGRNIGIEMTLEKFLTKGFYFLVTTSIFDSKYKGSDGVERNTAFNGNYTFNALFGKEFNLGKQKGKRKLIIDGKFTINGGQRFTPINETASLLANQQINFNNRAYESKYRDYRRADIRIAYRDNGKKVSQEWAFDIRNVFNTKNVFIQQFNPSTGKLEQVNQLGLFPVMQYKIEF